MLRLERSQRVGADLDEVFRFFSDPGNLARITPTWLRFRIRHLPARMEAGARIEYRIRWLFLRLSWITRITSWDPPAGFEDVQERGPYRSWRHTHHFEADGAGVRVRDQVDDSLPFGALGRLLHRWVVRRQLDAIFDYRRRKVDEIFGGARSPGRGEAVRPK